MEAIREELTPENTELSERDQKKSWLFFSAHSVPSVVKGIVFVFTAFFLMPGIASSAAWQWIGPARVYDMVREGSSLWLIDIRNSTSFEAGHIEGAVNIPSEQLAYRKLALNKTLVLVDDSLGQRKAKESAEMLIQKGYEKVYVLEGGLVAWKLDGHPVVEKSFSGRGVTVEELKWAISNKVPVKIFDMRDSSEQAKGVIQNAEVIDGKTMNERFNKLNELVGKKDNKDLSTKLKKPMPVILVFSATDDAGEYTRKALFEKKEDFRYLIGGYETFKEDDHKHVRLSGGCPTCPVK